MMCNGVFPHSGGYYGLLRGPDPSQNLIKAARPLIENAPAITYTHTHTLFKILFRGFVDLYESHPTVGSWFPD